MKGLLYFLFFAAIGAGIYFYFHKADNFRVKDQIVVTQASGMDISGPITAPPKYAVIKGTITNISDKNFNDIEVVYQSGLDTIRAMIGSLSKGQSSEFVTNNMKVRSGHPDYELIDIPCTEE
jgi:hypothetical protein